MMSKSAAFILVLLVSGLSPLNVVAQNSDVPAGATIQKISVSTNISAVTVEVEATAAVAPETITVQHPDRRSSIFRGAISSMLDNVSR
jgi:hypothetical protein